MDGSIRLRNSQRQALQDHWRTAPTHAERQRALILLMLDFGLTWATIITVLATSSNTIQRWQKRFHDQGIDGIRNAPKPGRRSRFASLIVACSSTG